MIGYVIASVISGVLFGLLDAVVNANPLALRLYQVYKPISRTAINPLQGIVIDLLYGFVIAGVFLILYESLPGETALLKGVSLAIVMWFFRVVMYALSQWVMFTVPVQLLIYLLLTGLAEMLVLGTVIGLILPVG